MGRQDAQGYFWLTGRTKELIIRGGHNIDPAVIENALIKHDAVREVAAVGKPDRHAGEVPVAYVVLRPGQTCEPSGLIEFAKKHIAEQAAVPKEIYLVAALPLTAVGKIFKPDLKRDAIRRVVHDVVAAFGLTPVISVDPDRTYGTVVTIIFESNATQKTIEKIKRIMAQYTFHVTIKNNQ
ncbi:MAG: hypothetical protein GXP02_04010 [Alphaproteobacteria bacterium]|nr:hypothetical protein [Alphaproteobacteria bacterium]